MKFSLKLKESIQLGSALSVKEHSLGPAWLSLASLSLAWLSLQYAGPFKLGALHTTSRTEPEWEMLDRAEQVLFTLGADPNQTDFHISSFFQKFLLKFLWCRSTKKWSIRATDHFFTTTIKFSYKEKSFINIVNTVLHKNFLKVFLYFYLNFP